MTLRELQAAHAVAERIQILDEILSGSNGKGVVNREARLLAPTAAGDIEVRIPESAWRQLLADEKASLTKRLIALGVTV